MISLYTVKVTQMIPSYLPGLFRYLDDTFSPAALSCPLGYYAIADNLASLLQPFAKTLGYDWHDASGTAHERLRIRCIR